MSLIIPKQTNRLLLGAVSLATLCLGARADTIVVDQSNGAGADFVDLPQAIASASHNDLLLVRSGSYSGFTTAKGIRILGLESNVEVSGPCVIQNLHSSRKFVLRNPQLRRARRPEPNRRISAALLCGYFGLGRCSLE
jgi:hypothetical protein